MHGNCYGNLRHNTEHGIGANAADRLVQTKWSDCGILDIRFTLLQEDISGFSSKEYVSYNRVFQHNCCLGQIRG